MSLQVRWAKQAHRDLKRLDPPIRRRVVTAVEDFAQTGEGDVKRLRNVEPPEFRLRIGMWRVRFSRDELGDGIAVLRVLPRDKAYR